MNRVLPKKDFDTHLANFVYTARASTYAGGGKYETQPERAGFHELVFQQDNWFYRDSFVGFFRSSGMEVVRYENTPVWAASYVGGVIGDDVDFARETFRFLKKALSVDNKGFESFRGPEHMQIGKWVYTYKQSGDLKDFSGEETISFQKKQVFDHRIIGGMIVDK